MKRAVSWDDWQSERRRTVPAIAAMEERLASERAGLRPERTAEEYGALRRAALDAIRNREMAGRLVWLGERRAVLRHR